LDLVTVFRACFIVAAIPVLNLLFGRKAAERNDDRMRNGNERTEREHQGEGRGSSADAIK
jgi:hypothetical protein